MTRRKLLARAMLLGGIAALVACQALAGIDDFEVGDCKGGNCRADGASDTALTETGSVPTVDSGKPCKGQQGPRMVRVGSENNTFCIDTTEVTNAQYQQFLAASAPLIATQDGKCAWNGSFQPNEYDAGPAPGPNHPQVGVDWCDAVAYCKWAGKYLCGKVENGTKVGPVTELGDTRSHQWLLACSAEGRRDYPYGAPWNGAKCNVADYDAGFALPVAEAGACVGGYDGIHDMLGNVWEWYDSPCSEDGRLEVDGGDGGRQSDACLLKGGSFTERGAGFNCRFDLGNIRRDTKGYTIGFRCCSD